MATWKDVRRLALELPETHEERSSSGKIWWMVAKKSFAWERPLRQSDINALGMKAPKGTILGIRTADLEMKDVIIASDPRVFFTIPHFDGYPAVLVQLDKIGPRKLKEVLVEAWLARAPKRAVKEFLSRNSRMRS